MLKYPKHFLRAWQAAGQCVTAKHMSNSAHTEFFDAKDTLHQHSKQRRADTAPLRSETRRSH